jgi:hypothetical protein
MGIALPLLFMRKVIHENLNNKTTIQITVFWGTMFCQYVKALIPPSSGSKESDLLEPLRP